MNQQWNSARTASKDANLFCDEEMQEDLFPRKPTRAVIQGQPLQAPPMDMLNGKRTFVQAFKNMHVFTAQQDKTCTDLFSISTAKSIASMGYTDSSFRRQKTDNPSDAFTIGGNSDVKMDSSAGSMFVTPESNQIQVDSNRISSDVKPTQLFKEEVSMVAQEPESCIFDQPNEYGGYLSTFQLSEVPSMEMSTPVMPRMTSWVKVNPEYVPNEHDVEAPWSVTVDSNEVPEIPLKSFEDLVEESVAEIKNRRRLSGPQKNPQ